eukprot:scaffold23735_cov18-Tisochrysis_lutea.AAC.4
MELSTVLLPAVNGARKPVLAAGHRKNSKKKEARIQGAILASQVCLVGALALVGTACVAAGSFQPGCCSLVCPTCLPLFARQVAQQSRRAGGAPTKQQQQQQQQQPKQGLNNAATVAPPKQTASKAPPPSKGPQ